jgi:hypothetical protein
MDYNKFIDEHQMRYCIHYLFMEYRRAKKLSRGQSLTEKGTGKIVPTPNQLISALAAKAPGDTAVKSELGGAVQRLMLAEKEQFLKLIGKAKQNQVSRGNNKPCSFQVSVEIKLERHLDLAKKLGLM